MPGATGIYVPVGHHWCYCKNVEGRDIWYPFSMADNIALEDGLKEGRVVIKHIIIHMIFSKKIILVVSFFSSNMQ